MNPRVLAWGLVAVFAGVAPAAGQNIYRWTDEHGVTHFTDSADKAPPAYRHQQFRRLQRGNVQVIGSAGDVQPARVDRGAELWEKKCSKCHHPGKGEVDEKEGLMDVLIDPETGFPEPMDKVVSRIRDAANGRFSDMPRLNVSDDDLRAIARFLLRQIK